MKEPAMPTLLVARHRPGFYCRVLEEGIVQAGDKIEKIAEGSERLTIADIDCCASPTSRVRCSNTRYACRRSAKAGRVASASCSPRPTGASDQLQPGAAFKRLRVAEIPPRELHHHLVPTRPDRGHPVNTGGGARAVPHRAGASRSDKPYLTRSYSLSHVADERGYRISVKRDGAGSRYLHDRVNVGDLLDVAAPRGDFILREGARPIVLISAGVGATPVLAMLHALVREHTTRPVWWLHGPRNRDEHAFGAEVDELLSTPPHNQRVVANKPKGANPPGADYDLSGRLDLTVLEQAGVPKDADYYLCGPNGLTSALGAALAALGVAPKRIATEICAAVATHASGIVKTGDRAPHSPTAHPEADRS